MFHEISMQTMVFYLIHLRSDDASRADFVCPWEGLRCG